MLAERGISAEQFRQVQGFDQGLHSDELKLVTCKLAALAGCGIYENTPGGVDSGVYKVLRHLTKAADYSPAHGFFRDVIFETLGKHTTLPSLNPVNSEELLKLGSVISSTLGMAARSGVALAPGMLKVLLGAGVLTGLGAGSLAWVANRHINEDSKEVEAKRQQAASYRQMRHDIEDRLASDNTTGRP